MADSTAECLLRRSLNSGELSLRRSASVSLPFLGSTTRSKQFFEITLILSAVGTLVPADDRKIGESFFGSFNYFHSHLVFGLPAHHLMVEDETVMVFEDVDPESKFHWYSRLALADLHGVGLKDGEGFFMMRDGFVQVDPADDLAHEFIRIAHVLSQK